MRLGLVALLSVFLLLLLAAAPTTQDTPSSVIAMAQPPDFDAVLKALNADDDQRMVAEALLDEGRRERKEWWQVNKRKLPPLVAAVRKAAAAHDDAKLNDARDQHSAIMKTVPRATVTVERIKKLFPPPQRPKNFNSTAVDLSQAVTRDLHQAVQVDVPRGGDAMDICTPCHMPHFPSTRAATQPKQPSSP